MLFTILAFNPPTFVSRTFGFSITFVFDLIIFAKSWAVSTVVAYTLGVDGSFDGMVG